MFDYNAIQICPFFNKKPMINSWAFLEFFYFEGYGSFLESPLPDNTCQLEPWHQGQGGNDLTEGAVIVFPQELHLNVPAETSLPEGTSFFFIIFSYPLIFLGSLPWLSFL